MKAFVAFYSLMKLADIRSQSARGLAQSKTSRKSGNNQPLLASWSAAVLCRFQMEDAWEANQEMPHA